MFFTLAFSRQQAAAAAQHTHTLGTDTGQGGWDWAERPQRGIFLSLCFAFDGSDGWVGGIGGWDGVWIGLDWTRSVPFPLMNLLTAVFLRPIDEFFRLVFVVNSFLFCRLLVEVEGRGGEEMRSRWRMGREVVDGGGGRERSEWTWT